MYIYGTKCQNSINDVGQPAGTLYGWSRGIIAHYGLT